MAELKIDPKLSKFPSRSQNLRHNLKARVMSRVAVRRFVVSGKVQGVFFRASTKQHALSLGLSGYAKNLADGSVEVFAVGELREVSELEQWLRGSTSRSRMGRSGTIFLVRNHVDASWLGLPI